MSHAGQGPSPKRKMLNRGFTWSAYPCEREFFVVWFNTITLKQFIAPFCC